MLLFQERKNIISSSEVVKVFFIFLFALFSISSIHFIFVKFSAITLLLFILIYMFLFAALYLNKGKRNFYFPNIQVVLFFFFVACIGKALSRYGYVSGLMQGVSVYSLRGSSASLGGWYSYLAIFFYPSALLIFFLNIRYKFSYLIYFIIYSFILFDVFFLAMRMAPVFVLIFHFIIYLSHNLKSKFIFFKLICVVFLLLCTFSYTTKIKSFDPDGFSWEVHLKNTISTQVVEFNSNFLGYESDLANSYLFLSHYIFHPIGEFSHYLASSELNTNDLRFLKLKEEFCIVVGCDVSNEIRSLDNRYGVYKTGFFVFIFDYGLALGLLFVLTLVALFTCFRALKSHFGFGYFFSLYLLVLTPIENFLFTGLGLLQISCIFIITCTSTLLSRISRR